MELETFVAGGLSYPHECFNARPTVFVNCAGRQLFVPAVGCSIHVGTVELRLPGASLGRYRDSEDPGCGDAIGLQYAWSQAARCAGSARASAVSSWFWGARAVHRPLQIHRAMWDVLAASAASKRRRLLWLPGQTRDDWAQAGRAVARAAWPPDAGPGCDVEGSRAICVATA